MSYILFVMLVMMSIILSQWIATYNPGLPTSNMYMAAGYNNHTIFILGGYPPYEYQLTEFNAMNNTFNYIGLNILSSSIEGAPMFYVQIDEILYMIETSGYQLATFNVINREFIGNWSDIKSVADKGCLAANNAYLFVLGGVSGNSHLKTAQILELKTKTWLQNGPPMQVERRGFSCIVDDSTSFLFAIGGKNDNGYLSSIETINTTNIQTQSWQTIDALTEPAVGTRTILTNNHIWIIGGYYYKESIFGGTNHYLDTMHIIDPIDLSVSLSSERLSYEVYGGAVIMLDNVIYCFGGRDDGEALNSWMRYILPTNAPTDNPTNIPTNALTDNPTNIPTNAPTDNPTNIPTNTPTDNPITNEPTSMGPTTANPTNIIPETTVSTTAVAATFISTTGTPTSGPTKILITSATNREGIASESITTLTSSKAQYADKNESDSLYISIIMASVVGVFLVIIGILICYYRHQRKLKQESNGKMVELSMRQKVSSVSTDQQSSSRMGASDLTIDKNQSNDDIVYGEKDDGEKDDVEGLYVNKNQQQTETAGNTTITDIVYDDMDSNDDSDGLFETNKGTKCPEMQMQTTKQPDFQTKVTEIGNL